MIAFQCLRYDPDTTLDLLGYIPSFLNPDDPTPAKTQLDNNYRHGGGWNSFTGFQFDRTSLNLQYPGDPAYHAVASTHMPISNELVIVYEHAWVLILNIDTKEWEVARMD